MANTTKRTARIQEPTVDISADSIVSAVLDVEPVVVEAPSTDVHVKSLLKDIEANVINPQTDEALVGKKTVDDIKDIDFNRRVMCTSITPGKVGYRSTRNNVTYTWSQIGASLPISIEELQVMMSDQMRFLTVPYIIIDDVNVVKYFNLVDKYEKLAQMKNLAKIIQKNDVEAIVAEIETLISVGLREVVVGQLRKYREDKLLTNIDVIQALRDRLKIDVE